MSSPWRLALATASIGMVANGCVRIEDAPCNGITLEPRSWSATVSQALVFRAQAPTLNDPRCTFMWVGSGIPPGQIVTLDQDAGTVRVVLSGFQGFYQLKATSVVDPAYICLATISSSDFTHSFLKPIVYPGGDDDFANGDVGVTGGEESPSSASSSIGPSTARSYVAFIRVDPSGLLVGQQLEQYLQTEFLAGANPSPRYTTQDTGFGAEGVPRLTVDAAGNVYWIRDRSRGGAVGRLTPTISPGAPPDVRQVSLAGIEIAAGSDLATDSLGRLFLLGRLIQGPECAGSQNDSPELLRVAELFGPTPRVERLGVHADTPFSTIEVDPVGRILLQTSAGLVRYLITTTGSVSTATLDSTFAAPIDFPPFPLRITVDGFGSIYVARYDTVDQGAFRVLNDLGQVIRVLGNGTVTALDLDRVRGVAAGLDGTLVVLDDVFVGAGNAAEVVVIVPTAAP